MSKVHLIMPMAGRGSRFKDNGYEFPKPLIQIYDKPFFFWAIRSVSKYVDLETLDFVVLREHVEKFNIDREIISCFSDAQIHILDEVTEGAVITCMEGIRNIRDSLPLLFNDCDHLFKCVKLNEFCNDRIDENIDGILLTFNSDSSKYSYAKKDNDGKVIKTAEKIPISDEAICGCYYFKNADVFKESALRYLEDCDYSEYFMSGVYNEMIKSGLCVKTMLTDFHVPFGVPEEFVVAQESEAYKELV